jgi:hypothetical protein
VIAGSRPSAELRLRTRRPRRASGAADNPARSEARKQNLGDVDSLSLDTDAAGCSIAPRPAHARRAHRRRSAVRCLRRACAAVVAPHDPVFRASIAAAGRGHSHEHPKHRITAPGAIGVRESAGLARSSTAPTVGLLEMHDSRPHPYSAGVTSGTPAGGARASRAAVPGRPGGRMTDPVGALRDPRLALPDPRRVRPVTRNDYPVLTRWVEERDHRVVAQAPGSNGSS